MAISLQAPGQISYNCHRRFAIPLGRAVWAQSAHDLSPLRNGRAREAWLLPLRQPLCATGFSVRPGTNGVKSRLASYPARIIEWPVHCESNLKAPGTT